MRLGISSYTYAWAVGVPGYPPPAEPLTAFDLLDKAVRLGVRVVQIADNLPLHELSERDLADLSRMARQSGVAIEVGTRGIAHDHLLQYTQIARRFQSPILRTVIEMLGPYVVNFHVTDFAVFRPPHNKGFIVEGRPAGQGMLDISELLRQLKQYGPQRRTDCRSVPRNDPSVILELWPPP